MVKDQLLKNFPDHKIIQHILDCFGLENLEDTRFFTKQHNLLHEKRSSRKMLRTEKPFHEKISSGNIFTTKVFARQNIFTKY